MSTQNLIGLTGYFGRAAFKRIIDVDIQPTPMFDSRIGKLIYKFGLREDPWEPAADFLRDEVIPVMDKNNEFECYMVMYLIRHMGMHSTLTTEYDPKSQWSKYAPTENHHGRIHPSYAGRYEAIINGLLDTKGVRGTVFEQYLLYPTRVVRDNPDTHYSRGLFAITYSL